MKRLRPLSALLTLAFASFLSASAHAGVNFRPDSPLPAELQAKIQSALLEACPSLHGTYEVYEVSTEVVIDRIDQGIEDSYYTSYFSVVVDGTAQGLAVRSAYWGYDNPRAGSRAHVLSIKTQAPFCLSN